ncbi:MAG: 2-dehydropantoate 2-reductase [Pseudomonadota bacterium]
MKRIRSIAIVGAGAMGAAYAAMFSAACDFQVYFVARGERYQKLSQGPITVNGKLWRIPVLHPDRVEHPADLVLVALKHHHLPGALQDIKAVTGEDTAILSVMNGLDSETIIGSVCGMDRMVDAIAVGIDAVREGEMFTYANPGKILFGNCRTGSRDPRLPMVREALERASIPSDIPPDIRRTLWWKFMINVGINQASAVLRAPYGIFQSSQDARDLMMMLMTEVINLARVMSINLTEKDLEDWLTILSSLSPGGKTSMLQDMEAGRKTEVDIFAGKMAAMGREHRVATPVNETILRIILAMESMHCQNQ